MNESILTTENLTMDFDGFKAIDNLNFSMAPGELRVVIGPNGAGKTTFLDLITGKIKPTAGQVLFKGKNIRRYSEAPNLPHGNWSQISNSQSLSQSYGS